MKYIPLSLVLAAALPLVSCKKNAETATTSEPAPKEAAVKETVKPEDYEKVLLDSLKESGELMKKFAEGGSKEDFIKGMQELAEKNKKLETTDPEYQVKASQITSDPKFVAAVQELQTSMQEIVTKNPGFAQKLADPEVQAALQNLNK